MKINNDRSQNVQSSKHKNWFQTERIFLILGLTLTFLEAYWQLTYNRNFPSFLFFLTED